MISARGEITNRTAQVQTYTIYVEWIHPPEGIVTGLGHIDSLEPGETGEFETAGHTVVGLPAPSCSVTEVVESWG